MPRAQHIFAKTNPPGEVSPDSHRDTVERWQLIWRASSAWEIFLFKRAFFSAVFNFFVLPKTKKGYRYYIILLMDCNRKIKIKAKTTLLGLTLCFSAGYQSHPPLLLILRVSVGLVVGKTLIKDVVGKVTRGNTFKMGLGVWWKSKR